MQVRLRAIRPSDPPIFIHQCDVEAAKVAGATVRTRPAFDEHWRKIIVGPEFIVRTIEAEGEAAGYISTFPKEGRAEIAYWLGREHRRKGIGQSAVSAFLEWYRERPIFGSVAVTNLASLAILRRCGFILVTEQTEPDGVREHVLRLD